MSLTPTPGSAADFVSKNGIEALRGVALKLKDKDLLVYLYNGCIQNALLDFANTPCDAWKGHIYGGLSPESDPIQRINLEEMVPIFCPKIIDLDGMTPLQIASIHSFVATVQAESLLDQLGPVGSAQKLVKQIGDLRQAAIDLGEDISDYARKWNYDDQVHQVKDIRKALSSLEISGIDSSPDVPPAGPKAA